MKTNSKDKTQQRQNKTKQQSPENQQESTNSARVNTQPAQNQLLTYTKKSVTTIIYSTVTLLAKLRG